MFSTLFPLNASPAADLTPSLTCIFMGDKACKTGDPLSLDVSDHF